MAFTRVLGPGIHTASNISSHNINCTGIITAVSFAGDAANLTGIAADKIFEGNTEAEVVDTGTDGHFKVTTEGTERLRVTSTGWQQSHAGYAGVGINTFASWARTGGAIRAEVGYNAVTTDYMYFGTGTNHPLALRVNNSNALYIKNDANRSVGIGTNNPVALLHVSKDVSTAYDPTADSAQRDGTATINVENNNGTTNSFAQIAFDTAGNNQSIARIVALRTGGASNSLTFVTEHSNTKAERLRITSDGNIGIGTTNPRGKLEVAGDAVISHTGANPLDLYKYGTAAPTILMYGANGTAASPTQTLTGDVIGGFNAFGYGSSGFAGGPSVRINAVATENNGQTSNRGADIKIETVATGGTSLQERLRITSDGSLLNYGNFGIQTTDISSTEIVGAGNSFVGMYLGDGFIGFSTMLNRSGGYYITTSINALNAGPVTLGSEMTLDGTWVIV